MQVRPATSTFPRIRHKREHRRRCVRPNRRRTCSPRVAGPAESPMRCAYGNEGRSGPELSVAGRVWLRRACSCSAGMVDSIGVPAAETREPMSVERPMR